MRLTYVEVWAAVILVYQYNMSPADFQNSLMKLRIQPVAR